MSTEDFLTGPDDWLDLRIGDTSTAIGVMHSVSMSAILLSFSDWAQLLIYIDIDVSPREIQDRFQDKRVRVRVERIEDGVRGLAIWEPGSVPTPLTRDPV